MSEVKDIFEVREPRLQILRRKASEKKPAKGLSKHMIIVEDRFISDHPSAFHKTLPRLPSTDDAFEDEDEVALCTPTIRPGTPPSTPLTPRGVPALSNSYPFLPAAGIDPQSLSPSPPLSSRPAH
ncbi:hypothetical protein L227DRAFT_611367 [Lentinus tigrinus ALCF2SS1-6]|uniref:Uncharacterized protein n=1 Tax=Lentinus tigrinus ALCF2SS1-6 TaxID=1328759 RepID=A0A5C2SAZ7_9APHY|nr:hypothetical protein L227DRAFT_611367 [Lentinus tigrinus ALCF2SS1-6]